MNDMAMVKVQDLLRQNQQFKDLILEIDRLRNRVEELEEQVAALSGVRADVIAKRMEMVEGMK